MDTELTALVVGAVIGAVGIVVGLGGIVMALRIAQKSGAFRKVELEVSLMGQRLMPNPEFSRVIYGYCTDQDDCVVCCLPFRVSNEGELSAKDVSLRLVFPMTVKPPEELEVYDVKGLYDKPDIRRRTYDHGGSRYVHYLFPELPPGGGSAIIEEAVMIAYGLGIPFAVDAVSKDGVPLRVEGRVEWDAPIRVGASATDVTPREGDFTLRSYRAQDKEELGQRIMEHETAILRTELSKIRASEHFLSNVYAPGVSSPAILVIPKLNEVRKPKEYLSVKGSVYVEDPHKSERWLVMPPRNARAIAESQWLYRSPRKTDGGGKRSGQ